MHSSSFGIAKNMSLAHLLRSRRSIIVRNTVSDRLPSTFFPTRFERDTSVAVDCRIMPASNISFMETLQKAISAAV